MLLGQACEPLPFLSSRYGTGRVWFPGRTDRGQPPAKLPPGEEANRAENSPRVTFPCGRPLTAPVQAYLGRVGLIWLCLVMAATVLNDLLRLASM